jgi:5-(carboxyamino)imidazole ribonucleotide mutase
MVENREILQQVKKHMVVIVMGSSGDKEYAGKIGESLKKFDVNFEMRIGSAHKSVDHVKTIMNEYDGRENEDIVYIAVAGRSNALGAAMDANTSNLVISAPPYGDKYAGLDIFSSLRPPSGIGNVVCTEPDTAAIAAAKVLALNNPKIAEKLLAFRKAMPEKIMAEDKALIEEQRAKKVN